MAYGSHLTFIQTIATQSPDELLFKLPLLTKTSRLDGSAGHTIVGWKNITYKQFLDDVEQLARYWLKVLGCSDGSTVGLWMAGMSYTDVADRVMDIFTETQVSVIICAPTAPTSSLQDRFQIHAIMDLGKLLNETLDDIQLPPVQRHGAAGDDIVMIYNTTGSTSGRPKAIRLTCQWLDINTKKDLTPVLGGKEVVLRVGSFSHMAQVIAFLRQVKNASCIVLTPWVNFTPNELIQIINECKINIIYQFAAILTRLLKAAASNPELTSALQSLKFIVHGGASIGEKESNWAMEHKILLKNVFSQTETSVLMISSENNAIFHPLQHPGLKYEFRPIDESCQDVNLTTSNDQETELS